MHLIPDLLRRVADLYPTAPAMEDISTGRRLEYRRFHDEAARAASVFLEEGVGVGARVAILCRNRAEFFIALFAVAKIGALLVPLNWRMPAAELRSVLADCAPALTLVGASDEAVFAAAANETKAIFLDDPSAAGWRARLEAADSFPAREFWPGADPWYLLYTSGSTGAPKAVIQTYQMALANYVSARQAIGLRRGDRTLNFLPLFHTAGVNLYALPFFFEGGAVAILERFDAGAALAQIREGLGAFFGVPAIYQSLAAHPDFLDTDLSRVGAWGCGGAPLPDSLVALFARRGARVCNGYGMTETGPTTFLVDAEHVEAKIGSVGRPRLLASARIVGADGLEAGPGEIGEMQLKGPAVTPGYWRNEAATRAAFTDDGWLKTGDLARRDEDGFYYIVGRSKEMFISGGENVYPAEVENALAGHPGVVEAAVIGVPDAQWGEVGKAFVIARDGFALDTDELTKFLRARIAAYKVPRRFVLVKDFPRTAAGKPQKHLLVEAQ